MLYYPSMLPCYIILPCFYAKLSFHDFMLNYPSMFPCYIILPCFHAKLSFHASMLHYPSMLPWYIILPCFHATLSFHAFMLKYPSILLRFHPTHIHSHFSLPSVSPPPPFQANFSLSQSVFLHPILIFPFQIYFPPAPFNFPLLFKKSLQRRRNIFSLKSNIYVMTQFRAREVENDMSISQHVIQGVS